MNTTLFRVLNLLLLFAAIFYVKVDAHNWEFGMRITEDGTTLISKPVYLYLKSDVDAGFLTPYRTGNSISFIDIPGGVTPNVKADINSSDQPDSTWEPITVGFNGEDYYLRIDNRYTMIHIPYTPSLIDGDFRIVYTGGNFSFNPDFGGMNNRGVTPDTLTTSDWVYIEKSVLVNQKLENNATVGTVSRWRSSSFVDLPQLNVTYKFQQGVDQMMKGEQNVITESKYFQWTSEVDVKNHHQFSITPLTANMISNFKATNNATLQAQLLDGGSPGGAVNFLVPQLCCRMRC